MLEQSIIVSVNTYIEAIKNAGINVALVVVFGSQVNGTAHEWSDIDLLVVSEQFDNMKDRSGINLLWRLAAQVDNRIEPIPCGFQQWQSDDVSAIIEIARSEGEILTAA